MTSKIIAVDFDGTCVTHAYPEIGENVGAAPVLRALVNAGHRLILWTVRSGPQLLAALYWFSNNEIELFGVNANPEQSRWSESPKAHANLFIDDLALGAPLVYPKGDGRAFVDWMAVAEYLRHSSEYEPVRIGDAALTQIIRERGRAARSPSERSIKAGASREYVGFFSDARRTRAARPQDPAK